MQCLTVKQPWATLLVLGTTQYLVRTWRTAHRGRLAIQASNKFPRNNVELCCDPEFRPLLRIGGFDYAIELPRQAVVGTVYISDCIYVTRQTLALFDPDDPAVKFGLLQPDSWAWICTSHERFPTPIPLIGRLGIYPIPDQLLSP